MADKLVKFDVTKVTRNKCLAWDPKGNAGKGSGVYTNDVVDDKGNVVPAECAKYGIDPATVGYITAADMPAPMRESAKAAVAYAAKESNMTVDDYIWSLAVADIMQGLANDSVKAHRPVTDKAKDRAAGTLRKVLEAQGKSKAEIDALLAALK